MRRHTYPEAASILRVEESWLRRHIKKLPHSKKGRVVTFSDADLQRIDDVLFHHEPATGPLAVTPAPPSGASSHPMSYLRPLPSRGRALENAS
ncbi:helix-turn-helix domain-containing protein [Streptomyces sp. NBC_01288]|uniref:helix-turn-helix domain-containing protein n=1 Tax=Streptomyces sp. NBC_01288 TaxID=2903814 RepID=UPI002E0F20E2|nr:helix-turn-helix domain-containing protein [Streptomyces sp. NBC_01288]